MAYYLTIKDKNNYKLLNISKVSGFTRLSKFKEAAYSLEDIDYFTSMFDNEVILKRILYDNGVITLEDITKDIEIRMKLNCKLKKVTYGLVYSNIKKYLDPVYLEKIFLSLQNDKLFISKLLSYYRNTHNQENLASIRSVKEAYNYEITMYDALSDFYKDEIYSVNYKTGEAKIKYKSLHDLAMFIYNYLYNKDKTKIEVDMIKGQLYEELCKLREGVTPVIVVKKRVKKKKTEIDGQTSFFD